MTSEVALMNRHGVALAADSAATVTYWNPETARQEERYFKRVNKIFNIMHNKPVGLMIYGTGSLQGMPWELIAKAFRTDRSDAAHEKLPGYADDLFGYIAGNRDMFSEDQQQAALQTSISESTASLAYQILFDENYKKETDAQKRETVAIDMITRAEGNIGAAEYINDVASEVHAAITTELENHEKHVLETEEGKFLAGELGEALLRLIVALGIERLFKVGITPLDHTGVVVSGYGDRQYLPQIEQYNVYGLFKNRLVYSRVPSGCRIITNDNASELVPIAQANMINTFLMGADVPTLAEIDSYVGQAIKEFTSGLVADGHLPGELDVTPFADTATGAFTDRVRQYIWKTHIRPMRQVIGMLSPSELAELAETLVSAESLKERVTRPTESVSGPVDVAVISKSDGFIWIKRKHYFDPSLNPRFFVARQMEAKVGT